MAFVSMCRVSQIIHLHFLRHPLPLNAWNSRKAMEWSSPHTLSFARFFFLKQLFSTNLKPRKYKISFFKTWNSLRVKKLAAHHIAWLGIYKFCQVGPKIPYRGRWKFNFWNRLARETEFWPPWRAAVSWTLQQLCLKKPMATVLPIR